MKRWLLLAALLLAACEPSSAPTPADVTTTEPATTVTAEPTTTTEPATTSTTAAPATTVTTRPRPATTAATSPPPTTPRTTAATTSVPAAEPCARALAGIRAVGPMEPGWAFYCETAIMVRLTGRASAGLAGWNTSEGTFIAINPRTGNHEGVGAHERCHLLEFATRGETSEASADACAAAHGHPNPYAGQLEGDTVTGETPAERVEEWLVLAVLLGVLVLIVALLTLLPAVRRRLRNGRSPE